MRPDGSKKGHVVLPDTYPSERRNHDDELRRARFCTADTDRDVSKGSFGMTPLYDLKNFDIVKDMPLDAMHLCDEGIIKNIFEHLFKGKTSQPVRALKTMLNEVLVISAVS